MKKLKLLALRFIQMIPVLIGISIIAFVLTKVSPGDPVRIILGPRATAEAQAALRLKYGLDEPLLTQYIFYIRNLLQGDWGSSMTFRTTVLDLIVKRYTPTLYLLIGGLISSILPSLILGIISSLKQDKFIDQLIRIFYTIGLGLPSYWLGLTLILIFAVKLGILPATGFGNTVGGHVRHIILPSMTIGIAMTPILVRNLRATLLEQKEADFVIASRSRGIPENYIFRRHVLPNSLLPSINLLGIVVVYILAISIVIEPIFAIPGLGQLFINSIIGRDYLVTQGLTLVFTVIAMIATLSVDLITLFIDPRIE